jgi:hypothetical protein
VPYRCEYVVESGERYVGEWEDGKPKWVQTLGEGSEETSKLSEDMCAKVEAALKVCVPGPGEVSFWLLLRGAYAEKICMCLPNSIFR